MKTELSTRISNGGIIAAAMVVGIHVCACRDVGSLLWWWEELAHYGVFSIAVPFFFVCSGYFLARHYVGGERASLGAVWWREVRKRLRSLFVPYVLWAAIAAAVSFCLVLIANQLHGRELAAHLPSLSWREVVYVFGLHPFAWPSLVPLWYVRALLIFVILSPFSYLAIKKWGGGAFCALIFLMVCGVALAGGSLGVWAVFFRKTFSLNGLFYFSMGMWLRVQEAEKVRNPLIHALLRKRWHCLLLGLLLVAIGAIGHYVGLRLQIVRVLFAPPLLLAFWSFLPSRPFPVWLTSSAFPIFLIHLIILRLPWPTACHYWPVRWSIGFGGALLLTLILRRVFPRMASLLFGGR